MKLSVVIPAYNEANTIREVIRRVRLLPIEHEIIVVDDGSTDETAKNALEEGAILLQHEGNRGKGLALRTGFSQACGEQIVVQDADLEYFPEDLIAMMEAMDKEDRPIVFGSRNLGQMVGMHTRQGSLSFYWGGKVVGWWCNFLFGTQLTDAPTGYKMFKREVLREVKLRCVGFEFCPEFCARAALAGIPIHEVPIRYNPRSRTQGKKIGYRHGIEAIIVLIKIRLGLW